jgi:ABC-type sugar transport system permease subunit
LYTYISWVKYWKVGYTSALALVQLIIMTIIATIFVRKVMQRRRA